MTAPGGSGRWPRRQAAGRVRMHRDRLGLTQEQFAAALGCSTVLVRSWERGVRWPSRMAEKLMGRLVKEQEATDGDA